MIIATIYETHEAAQRFIVHESSADGATMRDATSEFEVHALVIQDDHGQVAGFHVGRRLLGSDDVLEVEDAHVEASPPQQITEVAWLIERTSKTGTSMWFGVCGYTQVWTTADLAMRFARKKDADDAMALLGLQGCSATEHMWS